MYGVSDLENEALDLSNFEGGANVNGEMFDNYDGFGDPFLDFAGISKTFADAISRDTIFTIELVNVAVVTRFAYLFSGYKNLTGTMATGAFNDSLGNPGLSGTGSPQPIEDILNYVNFNPSLMPGFKIKSTVATQTEQVMVYQTISPFRNEQSQNIFLASYTDENTFQNNEVTVEEKLFIGNQSTLLLPIVASSTAAITLFFGVSLNTEKALKTKTQRAQTNISRIGAGRVRKAGKMRMAGGGTAQAIQPPAQ